MKKGKPMHADAESPLAIDLFCGLGGWAEGLLSENWRIIGFDVERHFAPRVEVDGKGGDWFNRAERGNSGPANNPNLFFSNARPGWLEYPGELVIQDVRTLHGSQFKDASLIVASPPCQEMSYMAMPWKRGRQIARALRGNGDFPDNYNGSRTVAELTELFDACFRIQREASEAKGEHIPMVVENVCGAQPWVGRAAHHFGSYYLWGDVPALMPIMSAYKSRGMNWSDQTKRGQDFTRVAGAQAAMKCGEAGWRERGPGRQLQDRAFEQLKCGGDWFDNSESSLMRRHSSKSPKRKMASALIAKIPFVLARWIAQVYKPAMEHQP